MLLYVRSAYKQTVLFSLYTQCNGLESVWVSLTDGNGETFVIASIYRPPSCPTQPFCEELEACTKKALKQSNHLVLTGDFNGKNSLWHENDTTDGVGEKLEHLFSRYQLNQLVNFPTYLHNGHPRSCLDLIATTFPSSSANVTPIAPIGNSDHLCISCTISCSLAPPKHVQSLESECTDQWSWTSYRVQSLKENLSLRLQPFDEKWAATSGVEELWLDWRSAVLDVGKQCCVVASRKSKPGSRRSYKAQPWITDALVCEIKMKHKLHRIYLRNRTLENWQVFTKQRNLVTRLLRDAKSQFILDSESTDGYRTTNLHMLTKCLRKTTSKSIPDLKSGDADFTSPQTKAEVLKYIIIQVMQDIMAQSGSRTQTRFGYDSLGSIMPEYALPSTPSKARSAEDGVRGSAYEGIFEP